MRLIDADALIELLEPHSLEKGSTIGWHSGIIDAVIDEISKMPTISGCDAMYGVEIPIPSDMVAQIQRCDCNYLIVRHRDAQYCPCCGKAVWWDE